MTQIDLEPLRSWFLQEKRDLPWRENKTPYRVWVSEVMLQQTQASRVILYFERWIKLFPTISHLAKASEQEVLKAWEGLGYYSRVRALHSSAKFFLENFNGEIPCDYEILRKVKGFGPYTTAAVLSFAFQQKFAACDANVFRVLARLFAINEDISSPKTKLKISDIAEKILPEKESFVVSEALIELGATVCKPKNPNCSSCPLQAQCQSYLHGRQHELPVKMKKTHYTELFREVIVILSQDREKVLLKKGESGKVMADLYEFPYFECEPGGLEESVLLQKIQQEFSLKTFFEDALCEVKQSFTRYRVTLYPKIFFSNSQKAISGYCWHPLQDNEKLAFSSGHRKIMNKITYF
jgi:A/G-specific adenine glycosylase